MAESLPDMQPCLERVRIVTLLGFRFWDPVQNAQVRDHLQVTARRELTYGPSTRAFHTASGVYAFQGLHGLQAMENPRADSNNTGKISGSRCFIIEVKDSQQRFLPVTFGVSLPLPYRGIFLNGKFLESASPPAAALPGFCLFSAPTRSVSPGLAVVRAQLEDLATGGPAAHAFMEVKIQGEKTWYGLADATGSLALMFPYPAFTKAQVTSPPSPEISFQEQRWELTLRIFYSPALLAPMPTGSKIPNLRNIIAQTSQEPAKIWATLASSPPVPLTEWPRSLAFGQELVLRTDDKPSLLISPPSNPVP